MGSESIAHETEAEWAIDSEAMRARGIMFLVKSNWLVKKYRDKITLASKSRFSRHCIRAFKAGTFCYWWATTYCLVVAQPIRTQH